MERPNRDRQAPRPSRVKRFTNWLLRRPGEAQPLQPPQPPTHPTPPSDSLMPIEPPLEPTPEHDAHNYVKNIEGDLVRSLFSTEEGEDDRIIVQLEDERQTLGFYDANMKKKFRHRVYGAEAVKYFNYLMGIYAQAEDSKSRSYHRRILEKRAGIDEKEGEAIYEILTDTLPREVISSEYGRPWHAVFGKLAFAEAQYVLPRNYEEAFAKRLEIADKEKHDLTAYGSASFTVKEYGRRKKYNVNLDSPESLVLARVVEVLGSSSKEKLSKSGYMKMEDVEKLVWKAMHTNERAAHVVNSKDLFTGAIPEQIKKIVRESVNFYTREMRLNVAPDTDGTFLRLISTVGIDYSEAPLTKTQAARQTTIKLHDTAIEQQELGLNEPQEAELLATARDYLTAITGTEAQHFTDNAKATDLLEFLMTRPGRYAMRKILSEQDTAFKTTHQIHDYLAHRMLALGMTGNALVSKQVSAFASR